MVETNPMYDPGCNHDLPIPGPGCNRGMWTCRYPECTYPEAAPRRVRTQAERAGDGTAWRAPEAPAPALLLTITSPVTLNELAQIRERFTQRSGQPVHLTASLKITRRRWWHRLTRRNP